MAEYTLDDYLNDDSFANPVKQKEEPTKNYTREDYLKATEEYGKEYNVAPILLQGVAYGESNFDPNAKSNTGAEGLMQFIGRTAKQYGVDTKDPMSSIKGAAAYINDLGQQFNDDKHKVLAAYNAGPQTVKNAMSISSESGLEWDSESVLRTAVLNNSALIQQLKRTKPYKGLSDFEAAEKKTKEIIQHRNRINSYVDKYSKQSIETPKEYSLDDYLSDTTFSESTQDTQATSTQKLVPITGNPYLDSFTEGVKDLIKNRMAAFEYVAGQGAAGSKKREAKQELMLRTLDMLEKGEVKNLPEGGLDALSEHTNRKDVIKMTDGEIRQAKRYLKKLNTAQKGITVGNASNRDFWEGLQEAGFLKEKDIKDLEGFGGFVQDLIRTSSHMGESVAIYTLAGPVAGIASTASNIMGAQVRELKSEGVDYDKMTKALVANTILGTTLESVVPAGAAKILKGTANSVSKSVLKTVFKEGIEEALTEGLQTYSEEFTKLWAKAENENKNIGDAVDQFVTDVAKITQKAAYASLLGLTMGGGTGATVSTISKIKNKEQKDINQTKKDKKTQSETDIDTDEDSPQYTPEEIERLKELGYTDLPNTPIVTLGDGEQSVGEGPIETNQTKKDKKTQPETDMDTGGDIVQYIPEEITRLKELGYTDENIESFQAQGIESDEITIMAGDQTLDERNLEVDQQKKPSNIERGIENKIPETKADLRPGSLKYALDKMGVTSPEGFVKMDEDAQAEAFAKLDEEIQQQNPAAVDAGIALDRWLENNEQKVLEQEGIVRDTQEQTDKSIVQQETTETPVDIQEQAEMGIEAQEVTEPIQTTQEQIQEPTEAPTGTIEQPTTKRKIKSKLSDDSSVLESKTVSDRKGEKPTVEFKNKVAKEVSKQLPKDIAKNVKITFHDGTIEHQGVEYDLSETGTTNGLLIVDKKNNTAEIYVSDNLNVDETVKTLGEEVVGHYGVTKLLASNEKLYNKVSKVFNQVRDTDPVAQELREQGYTEEVLEEEWIAHNIADLIRNHVDQDGNLNKNTPPKLKQIWDNLVEFVKTIFVGQTNEQKVQKLTKELFNKVPTALDVDLDTGELIGSRTEVDPAKISEVIPELKYDGIMEGYGNVPNSIRFTAYEGPIKGATFYVNQGASLEDIKKKYQSKKDEFGGEGNVRESKKVAQKKEEPKKKALPTKEKDTLEKARLASKRKDRLALVKPGKKGTIKPSTMKQRMIKYVLNNFYLENVQKNLLEKVSNISNTEKDDNGNFKDKNIKELLDIFDKDSYRGDIQRAIELYNRTTRKLNNKKIPKELKEQHNKIKEKIKDIRQFKRLDWLNTFKRRKMYKNPKTEQYVVGKEIQELIDNGYVEILEDNFYGITEKGKQWLKDFDNSLYSVEEGGVTSIPLWLNYQTYNMMSALQELSENMANIKKSKKEKLQNATNSMYKQIEQTKKETKLVDWLDKPALTEFGHFLTDNVFNKFLNVWSGTLSYITRRLDRFDDNGVFKKNVMDRLNEGEANTQEFVRQSMLILQQATEKLGDKMYTVSPSMHRGLFGLIGRDVGKRKVKKYNYKDANGKDFTITADQKIALYMISQQEAGLLHLLSEEGGFKLKNESSNVYKLNYSLLEDMIKLSEEEQIVADVIREYFDFSGREINKTSMEDMGYEIATEDNYFSLFVASSSLNEDMKKSLEGTELNRYKYIADSIIKSNLKARKNSKKPLVLVGATEAVSKTNTTVAEYVGKAIPMRDVKAIINGEIDVEGVKGSLEDYMKENGLGTYYMAMKKIIGEMDRKGSQAFVDKKLIDMAKFARGLFTKGVLGLNLQTALIQPISYFNTFTDVSYQKYYPKRAHNPKYTKQISERFAEALKKNPYLWARYIQGINLNVGEALSSAQSYKLFMGKTKFELTRVKNILGSIKDNEFLLSDNMLAYLARFDAMSIRGVVNDIMWDLEENQGLEYGTDEFWTKANQKMTDVIQNTQPTFELLNRPLVTNNEFLKMFTMFTSQPVKNLQLMKEGVFNVKEGLTRLKKNESGNFERDNEQIRKGFKQLFTVGVFQPLIVTSLREGVRTLRGKEDDEPMWKKILIGTIATNLGALPILGTIGAALLPRPWNKDKKVITRLIDSIDEKQPIIETGVSTLRAISAVEKYANHQSKKNLDKAKERTIRVLPGLGIPANAMRTYIEVIQNLGESNE